MPEGTSTCRHCKESIAVWRCRDCVLATPMCRSCIRFNHRENPFHRIERWNGSFFRPADLREVGTYLLVQHHTGSPMCDTLTRWCNILDSAEITNDGIEQERLRCFMLTPDEVPDVSPDPASEDFFDGAFNMDFDIDEIIGEIDEDNEDNDLGDLGDGDEEEDDSYISADPALASVTLGALQRVVHTNGIHHISMVSCQCHGKDVLPLDLFALQLLPASLKRIKTIFTAQVLDMYRLSNLELKASAYQFYHLLRRLTQPMSPAEVVNLYREFRRMTRIWRWMKKLKWAGYAGSSKKVKDVGPGELAIFCPACPQSGINIPENWREDPARHVEYF